MNTQINTFSSYTKGLHPIIHKSSTDEEIAIRLEITPTLKEKILKKIDQFPGTPIVSINGVQTNSLSFPSHPDDSPPPLVVTINTLFMNVMANQDIELGKRVSIGLTSKNPEKYLLDGAPIGTVTLKKIEIAAGHKFTQELTFQCPSRMYEKIEEGQYVGLNGSGLTIKSKHKEEGHFFFSVHSGKTTRKLTVFNKKRIKADVSCTLTFPHKELQITT